MKEIPDPSAERSKPHSLEVFLFIALAIFVTEGQSFLDMEWYAETRLAWLEENIRMICVPVHETLSLLTQAIPPKHVSEHLISLTNKLREKILGVVGTFDEKTYRGVKDDKSNSLHVLNVWTVGNKLVLG